MTSNESTINAGPADDSAVASDVEQQRVVTRRSSLLRWLVPISRFGLAALFLFTAIAKLAILRDFAANVAELLTASGLSWSRWMWPTTISVIVIEVISVILLLVPRTVRLGALLVGLLLVGFSGFALYYVYVLHGEPLECGCFGKIIGSQLGVKTALRNLGLLIPVLIIIFGYKRNRPAVVAAN